MTRQFHSIILVPLRFLQITKVFLLKVDWFIIEHELLEMRFVKLPHTTSNSPKSVRSWNLCRVGDMNNHHNKKLIQCHALCMIKQLYCYATAHVATNWRLFIILTSVRTTVMAPSTCIDIPRDRYSDGLSFDQAPASNHPRS